MPKSRTIKTLAVLLVAMTIGAFALMIMESDPLPAKMAAVEGSSPEGVQKVIANTSVSLQNYWRRVVVHSSTGEPADIANRCHFVIDTGADGNVTIRRTDRWQTQAEGNHVALPSWNSDSIGVLVVGDFSRQGPSNAQYEALVNLVCELQHHFRIPRSYVYWNSHLSGRTANPEAAFPMDDFNSRLIADVR